MKAIYEFLELSAEKYPNKIAITDDTASITYNELLKKSKFVSNSIRDVIKCGQSVSLLSENSISFIIAYFGILMAGGIVHIVPPNSSDKQLQFQIEKVKPVIIVCSETLVDKITRNQYKHILISELINNSSKINHNDIHDKFNEVSSVIFTSGTTGTPKGVKLKHENIIFVTKNIIKIIGVRSDDVEINPLQLSHSFGLGCLHTTIAQGATSIIFRNSINLKEIIDAVTINKATGFIGVPATFQKILFNYKQEFKEAGKNFHYLLTNSAPMPKDDIQEIIKLFPLTNFFTYYGLTEASRSTFLLFNNDIRKIESVGKPAPNVQLKIITDNDSTSNEHDVGEVLIKGPNVIDEYWADTVKAPKIKDGWLATGDLGFLDSDGYLYLKGRKDDIINVGGEKVSPIEIELMIKQLDKIQDVGVIGVPDKTFGEIPVAFIVTEFNLETNEILGHCIKTLERYKIPQNFIFVDSIPKNESGKIERNALREIYAKQ
jgi:long-chain acyl-CoA synthetase